MDANVKQAMADFFVNWLDGWSDDILDTEEALELAIAGAHRHGPEHLPLVAAGIREVLASSDDDWGLQRAIQDATDDALPSDVRTRRSHLTRILRRVEAGGAYDEVVARGHDHWRTTFGLPRLPDFQDIDIANDFSTQMVRLHRAFLDDWDRRRHLYRVHLYHDFGTQTGTVLPRGSDEPVPVTAVHLTMEADKADEPPVIISVAPDYAVDTAWAKRYPVLPHLFGGWFGAARFSTEQTPWVAQACYVQRTHEEGLAAVNEQLHALLADVTEDDELLVAVDALGSYLFPTALRPWLERMADRIDDWLAGDIRQVPARYAYLLHPSQWHNQVADPQPGETLQLEPPEAATRWRTGRS